MAHKLKRINELLASISGASILPNDRRTVWFARLTAPCQNSFTLICYTDCGDRLIYFVDDFVERNENCIPDLDSIVFYPTRLRKMLGEFSV
jgi:hypothetical protein